LDSALIRENCIAISWSFSGSAPRPFSSQSLRVSLRSSAIIPRFLRQLISDFFHSKPKRLSKQSRNTGGIAKQQPVRAEFINDGKLWRHSMKVKSKCLIIYSWSTQCKTYIYLAVRKQKIRSPSRIYASYSNIELLNFKCRYVLL
jgi:hypothetical protein